MAVVKIVIVDDEYLVCDVIADGMRSLLGATVETAFTGRDAAALLENDEFNLAIIDATLPDMSGLDLARLAANRDVPVVLISGDAGISLRLAQFDYPFLVKPFSISALIMVSSRVIAESQENIHRIKMSTAKLIASDQLLTASSAALRQRLDESEAKWRRRGIVLQPSLHDELCPPRKG